MLGEELGRKKKLSTNLHLSVSDRCEYKSGFQKSFEVRVRGERSTPHPCKLEERLCELKVPSQGQCLASSLEKIWSTNLHLSETDRCQYKSRFQKSFDALFLRGARSTPHPCKLEERLCCSSAKPRVVLGEEL